MYPSFIQLVLEAKPKSRGSPGSMEGTVKSLPTAAQWSWQGGASATSRSCVRRFSPCEGPTPTHRDGWSPTPGFRRFGAGSSPHNSHPVPSSPIQSIQGNQGNQGVCSRGSREADAKCLRTSSPSHRKAKRSAAPWSRRSGSGAVWWERAAPGSESHDMVNLIVDTGNSVSPEILPDHFHLGLRIEVHPGGFQPPVRRPNGRHVLRHEKRARWR